MPAEKDHITQAQLNEQFIQDLQNRNTGHGDWVVTVAFYAALHWVDAYLARRADYHSRKHGARSTFLTTVPEIRTIYGDYEDLYNLSRDSRYDCLFSKWTPAEVNRVLKKLQSVKQHLTGLP